MKIKISSFLAVLALALVTCSKDNTTPKQQPTEATLNERYGPPQGLAHFYWQPGDNCNYRGYYDPEKITHKQLEDTYYMCTKGRWTHLDGYIPPIPESYYTFDTDEHLTELKKDYLDEKEHLENLDLVPGKEWEDMRQYYLKKLAEKYEIEETAVNGVNTPETLLKSRFCRDCLIYAEGLNADDKGLMKAWYNYMAAQHEEYKDSGFLEIYEERRNSPDSLVHARISLLHAWLYCTETHRDYDKPEDDTPEKFKTVFQKVDKKCLE